MSQDIFVMDASLAENIALGIDNIDYERIAQVVEQCELKDAVDSLPDGVYTKIGQDGSRLSGGERQRLGIARALYKKAKVLFFDEATSALDLRTENEIINTIRQLWASDSDLTIIIIAHRESALTFCDRIINMDKL
ncbi:ABC-type multidrug transport system fused ATPase/permease subunit [Dysgonomonas sp. PH5-45]|uniref:ATP-binding cassette domain-containing protein n=1 Tax=unclassified Dysgonomonas TaxID=2630389 RepID=UPI002473BA59|nr:MULTISPECIES: ABC transporter ATP-binding protein [unclassified Dysgonomonas]MDH6353888.1 ABC-type multidrug transport system fused ATPase/permease subunit [Dysgonomonas sp. PH5-45]MDH6386790.1 ABC-type multidrug transport system fused ATPase/permease subunit [Dysgonomonas sp. PH5-37]